MKPFILICSLFLFVVCCKSDAKKQIVELSCGQCQFGLESQEGCDLAVRINNQAYFVDGAEIDDFGDAHDKDTGFCEAIRKAEVTGELSNNRFEITSVKLLD
jgi:hypothetical protein